MGIWSCLGQNLNEVKESLYAGRSGIGVERERLDYGYRSGLTGLVPRPQLKGVIDRRLRVGLSEEAEYAYMASRQAFEQSLMDEAYLRENEVGILFGNDSSAKPVIEAARIMREAAEKAGLPENIICWMDESSIEMTQVMMKEVNLILATGGSGMGCMI